MEKHQAQNLIKKTFENPFEKDRFSNFVKNLLNKPEDAYVPYRGNLVPDAYKPYISSLERLFKYSDGEHKIDILVVQLKRETSLERARTMQRNFIAWYLNGSRGGEMKDAALVAFVSPGEADWRFSLVKMDYRFEETKAGKVKVKEEFTPARRWSFLVGSNEASHTAQSRLVPPLADDEHNPTLKQLEDAFDIETVSKEFFRKYRDLFIRVKEALDEVVEHDPRVKSDFEAKGVDTVNFAKKLLGQIMFLYFLQKKGWFGVERDAEWGTGSKHFLRQLFTGKHGEYNNFFNDILEPLFYEALRIDRRHDDDYYSHFNCKIPFLNGGLFDPTGNYDWVHTDIMIPNELFSNQNQTEEGDTGDGILDVFDRYNFTVKEDEPLEKEVAIDPELLGKAYEKFNAIRPDNFEEYKAALKTGKKGAENKFNKKFGVYYTPREIVHYMCQQSLINYLYSVTQASSLKSSEQEAKQEIYRQGVCDTIMYYDPDAPTKKKRRNLPHWQQKATAYFVTFRLFDSIPKQVAEEIRREREQWLKSNNISDLSELKKLSGAQKIEYYRLFSKRYDELLDNGYGCCVLAKPECKEIVESALKHFDGERYALDTYVIMPNHVHTIVRPQENWDLAKITHSWKSFTSNEINKILGRKGQLWMPESFDHIIRSPLQLEKIHQYIADNPRKSKVSRASQPEEPEPLLKSHRQDACVTISKEDIETLIKFGEQVGEHEAAVQAKGRETRDYSYKLPESIRQNAEMIDRALANITVCDPAIGSGAFPVGMMHEIVKTRNVLTAFISAGEAVETLHATSLPGRTTYQFKRECIEKSLYGVDIDPGAVEIAKLRLWLSLVVEEEDIRQIKPLPNLDYKIVCGNSLLGVEKNLFNNELFAELERLKPLHFDETNPTKKQEYKKQIDGLISQITNGHTEFDFEVYFSEVFHEKGGFDVVIANPPYLRIQEIQKNSPKLAKQLKADFISAIGSFDIYACFVEQAVKLICKEGTIAFILPHKFFQAAFGKNLRRLISSKRMLRKIVDFGSSQVFETATTYTCLLFLSHRNQSFGFAELKPGATVNDLSSVFNFIDSVEHGETDKVSTTILSNNKVNEKEWHFSAGKASEILFKLNKQPRNLSDVCDKIFVGLQTSADKIYFLEHISEDDSVVTAYSKSLEKEIQIEKDFVKPLLKGADVHRYMKLAPRIWCIFPYKIENKKAILYTQDEIKKFFPMAWEYLLQNKRGLENRENGRMAHAQFYAYIYPKNLTKFEKTKIVTPEISYGCNMTYDYDGLYHNTKCYSFIFKNRVNESPLFYLALLNSKLLWFFLTTTGYVLRGGYFVFKTNYLMPFPIPSELTDTEQQPFISLVDRILAITKDEDYLQNPQKQANVKALEQEIDRMVYKLYGLTPDEIKIVEGENSRR